MSQNIALTITLGGTQKAVSNIEQLEVAIQEARTQLKGLEIGSAAFNKLASDVKVAENRLKDLNKQIEGKDLEARIGDFGKLGGAIGATFASATAAVQLFGADSEESLKAVTTAQNALTLALGAKAAAEGAYVIKQYASIAATKIQTIVTNNLTSATKGLFDVLKANPYTAILVAVTAIITAMIGLNEETEQVVETFDDLTDAQNKAVQATIGETQRIKALSTIVNDANEPLSRRLEAYKELQKVIPTLAGYTLEQATNEGLLNKEIKDQITLIEERARARAIETKVTELYTKQFDLVIAAQDELNTLGGKATQFEAQLALQRKDQVGTLAELARQYQENQKQVDFLTGKTSDYSKSVSQVLDIESDRAKRLADLKSKSEALAKAEQERLRLLQIKINLEIEEQRLANQLAIIQRNALTTAQGFTEEETKIIPILRQRLETQKAMIETNKQRLTQDQKLLMFAAENEGIIDKAGEVWFRYNTQINGFVETVRAGNTDLVRMQIALDDISKFGEKAVGELSEFITPEGLENFRNYVNNQKILAASLIDISKYGTATRNVFNDYLNITEELNDANLTYEQRAQKLVDLEEKRRLFVDLFVAKYTGFSQKQIQGIEKITEKQKEQIQGAKDLANVYLTNLPQVIKEIGLFEEGVSKVNKEANSLNDKLRQGFPQALAAYFKQNRGEIAANLKGIIDDIQAVVGAFSQATNDYFNFQFDTLEKRYKRVQEGIIGDSEEANKKRMEAEKAYQAERARLEKAAAKRQLQITLAQSIANTAGAIVKAYEQLGAAGFPVAAILAGISAGQTAIIAQQLAAVDSYQRGGRLKKQGGGLVTGPSHEFGGVKFQGGGIELEGNEAIINRVSTINYMGLLDQINQAGGGAPISSIANESRLMEAIAKQRNTPIRAYVVESDITAKQETARRLESLSQF